MAAHNRQYYLLKLSRLSGWLLLFFVAAYLFTGFVACGKYGANRLLAKETAVWFHSQFDILLLGVFSVHSATSVYFALKRWGWLKRR